MSTVHPLEPGDPVAVGGYNLSGRLGSGGQAVVYLGRGSDGQAVAIKVFNDAWLADPEARARARQEATALLDVARYATTPLVAAALEAHPPYLVSEYVPGPSLQEAVRRDGPLPAGAVERLAANTLTALMAVHQAGIVHRDLKPANIVLGPDGPRLVDFGISGYRGARETSPDGVLGTPAFMSPEQVRGEPAAPSSDMFSWAATMAFAATGGSPFAGGTQAEVVQRVEHGVPDLAGVPAPLAGLLARCLSKDPGARPTAQDALGLLVAAADRAPDRSPSPLPAWGTPTPLSDLRTPPPTPAPQAPPPPVPGEHSGLPRRTVIAAAVAAAATATALFVREAATPSRPGGRTLASAPVRPVSTPSGTASPAARGIRIAEPYENRLSSPWFTPDGRHTAWLDDDGFLHLVSVTSGQEEQLRRVGAGTLHDGHLSPDGTVLVSFAADVLSVLAVVEVATGKVLAELDHHAHVSGAVFTPDGRHLLVATFEEGNRVWRLPDGVPVGRQIKGRFASLVISPDGRYVMTWSEGDGVPVRDVATGAVVRRLTGEMRDETAAAFSPDNALMAVASQWGPASMVSLYRVSDGEFVAALSEAAPLPEDDLATDSVTSLVFSPDSSRLAAATRAGTVRVWDVASASRVGPVRSTERYTLRSLRFSPDGRLVAARHLNGTVMLWPVTA
jgi:serine/threonine protein kinase